MIDPITAEQAMQRALTLARMADQTADPNPRVGCVIIDATGRIISEGVHRGAGTPHAEVVALTRAGPAAAGATAVVTLEPCNHTGRTGPCSQALITAGISRVVFAQTDPNPDAAGGAATLRAAGVTVTGGLFAEQATAINRAWSHAVRHRRPYVTWKYAASLDGRSAAADGSSRWITSAAARRDVHRLRADCDVIMAGTGTVLIDDPELTVRDERDQPLHRDRQPLRVVVGTRPVPGSARVLNDAAETVIMATHDLDAVLTDLGTSQRRHVFLEGGPTLAAAMITAGHVDEVVGYLSPTLLGAGRSVVGDLGITTMADILRLDLTEVRTIGQGAERTIRITAHPQPPKEAI